MQARRRIGLGLFASGAVHLAAAGVALWLADRDRGEADADGDADALGWAEVELVVEPDHEAASRETTAASAVTGARPPGRPSPAATEPSPAATEPSPAARPARSGDGSAAHATAQARVDSTTGRGSAGRDDAGRDDAATRADPAAPSPPPPRTAPSGPASLDPRRAAEGIFLDPGPPPPPGPLDGPRRRRPVIARSELRPDGPGGFQTDEGVFVARTGKDGSVSFADRRNLRVHIALPTPRGIARVVESWYDSLAPGRAARERDEPDDIDRSVPEAATSERSGGTVPILGGGFDLTDGLMRGSGQDPYAARKLAFLDRTRAERMEMAAVDRSARLRESLQRTRADLEQLWRGPDTPARKRHLLFLLWDECAEDGSDEVVGTARAVRGAIVGFVRRRLPAGSAHAFTAAELAAENARRTSTARFDPYAAPR